MQVLLVAKVLAEDDLGHVDRVLGALARGDRADDRLVGVLQAAVGHVQVTVGHRHVHRLHDGAAGDMHRLAHVVQLLQVVQVLQGGVTPLQVQVAYEGGPIGRREDHVLAADLHRAFRVAGMLGVGLGCLVDQLHQEVAADADPLALHIGAGLAPDIQGLFVAELDPYLLGDAHGHQVDQLDPFIVHHFVGRDVAQQGRLVEHRRVHPGRPAPRAPAAPCAFALCHRHDA